MGQEVKGASRGNVENLHSSLIQRVGKALDTDTTKPASQGEEKKPETPTAQTQQQVSAPRNGQDVQKTLKQQQNKRLHKAINKGNSKHGGSAHKKGHTHKNTRSRKGGRK
jgi:uncharacterized protein with von Willebrand factor type A (vWA) domain